MNNTQYFAELERLKNAHASKLPFTPTRGCIDMFLTRVSKGQKMADEECDFSGDSIDYYSWGYAIFDDIFTSGETEQRNLQLFEWAEYYESPKSRIPKNSIIEVHHYWNKGTTNCLVTGTPFIDPANEDHPEDIIMYATTPQIKSFLIVWCPIKYKWEFIDGYLSLTA